MTLKSRNRLIVFSFFFTIIPLSLFTYTVLSYLNMSNSFIQYLYVPNFYENLFAELIINALLLFFSFFAALLIFWNFRKTTSIEIFFLISFLLSCTFFSLRPLLTLLIIEESAVNYQIIVGKFIYFSHFLTLSLLFFTGFYKIGIESRRSEWSFIAAILISFMLTTLFPIDITEYTKALHSTSGNIPSILMNRGAEQPNFSLFLTIFFSFIAVANFLIIWLQTNEKRYLYLGITILFIATSIALVLYQTKWQIEFPAIIIFILSIGFFAKQTHTLYKWI